MATLTGNARNIADLPAGAIPYTIKSLARAVVVDGRVVVSGEMRRFTGADGSFAMTLEAGDYEVLFNGTDRFVIAVPNDEVTRPFLNCVTSSVTQPGPPPAPVSWPNFPADGDWIVTSGGGLIARSRSSGKYHRVYVTGPTDEPQLVIDAGTNTP